MKKLFISFLLLSVFTAAYPQTQHGLEKIIIEKYYVSDSSDAAKSGGRLPVGSVTYRIFVDLLPAYRLQAVYGVPGHEMRIATTTVFFNHENYGAATANNVPLHKLSNNTVMLDSWLSVGAGAEKNYAILKDDDTSQAVSNADSILRNNDSRAGIPLYERDGMFIASPMSVVTIFGIDSLMNSVFGNKNQQIHGQVFATDNGSWASFGGAIGVQPMNRVLIAQLTTNGELFFKLNLQIGTPDGKIENYVA